VLYLASLPFGWMSYRNHARKDAEERALASPQSASAAGAEPHSSVVGEPGDEDRPTTRH
jgi:CDP-diacylglycerol--serine O-phosphatidyltransferase